MLSQHTTMLAQTFPLKWYTSANGLPHSRASRIVQDSDGYFWCGTLNGVSRFDGNEFQNFNSRQSGLAFKAIQSLVLDSTGTGIWCSVDNEGVYHIDRYGNVSCLARFINNEITLLTNIERIASGESNSLWFTTSYGSLIHFFNGYKWKEYSPKEGYDFGRCRWPLWYLPSRELWTIHSGSIISILDVNGGARKIDIKNFLPAIRAKKEVRVLNLTPNRKTGGLWMITSVGVICVEGSPATFRFFPQKEYAGHFHFSPSTDKEGNLWYVQLEPEQISYAYKKISYKDGSTLTSIGRDPDLAKMLPFGAIYEDREGSVWICANGLAHLSSTSVLNYQLSNREAVASRNFIHTKSNQRFLSSWNGIYQFHDDKFTPPEYIFHYTDVPAVSKIFEDPDGDLHWYHVTKGSFVFKNNTVHQDQIRNIWSYKGKKYPITEIAELTTDGTLVFINSAEANRLFFVTKKGDSSSVFLRSTIPNDEVKNDLICATRNYKNKSNSVIILSKFSLWEFRDRSLVHQYSIKDGYRAGEWPSICEDSTGMIWIGFRSPSDSSVLIRFDGKKFYSFTMDEIGIQNPYILGLCAHPNRRDLIVLTTEGLYIISLQLMKPRKHLTERDGLYIHLSELFVDKTNDIWIAAAGGITRYDESQDQINTTSPKVVMSSFTADEFSIKFPNQILQANLDHPPNRIEFKFSALSFTTQGLLFQTMLSGLEDEWSAPSMERFVRYTNLGPGSYTFKVKASDANGRWNSFPAEFVFVIPPPFYRTWWFILLVILIFFGALYSFYRYRLAHVMKMERMRSTIALDLHDEIGSTLTSISFISSMAEKEIRSTHPTTAEKMQKIGETARSVVDMMSDIIWSLKPEHDSFGNLVRRISDMATEMCEGLKIHLQLDLPTTESHIPLRMEYRRNIYLIAKEALHNIIKHSQCTDATITMSIEKEFIELRIEDNGIGISQAQEQRTKGSGTGLTSMKKRAGELRAEFVFESKPGDGTKIIVRVPKTKYA